MSYPLPLALPVLPSEPVPLSDLELVDSLVLELPLSYPLPSSSPSDDDEELSLSLSEVEDLWKQKQKDFYMVLGGCSLDISTICSTLHYCGGLYEAQQIITILVLWPKLVRK